MSAIRKLAANIIDYAGLFPPAQLPLPEVIHNFELYLKSEFSWMLSHLVLPSSKLGELESSGTFVGSKNTWKISALVPPISEKEAFESAIAAIDEFNQRHQNSQKAVVDNVEIRTPTIEAVAQTGDKIPDNIQAFFEIPYQSNPDEYIRSLSNIGRSNVFAKIRTGGVTEDLIPTPSQVAKFISACAQHDVGMKATAGLHHPIRGEYRLTYEPNAVCGVMFGFLNIFIAGCFAYTGYTDNEWLTKILSNSDANRFKVSEAAIQFEQVSITCDQIEKIRLTKLTTFGSCSFTEPTSELDELGWLTKVSPDKGTT